MRKLVACIAVLASAGCSSVDWHEMRTQPREFFNLTAPVLVTGEDLDGRRVMLKRSQALVVRLDEEPQGGPRWEMRPLGPGVTAPVQRDFVAKREADETQAPAYAVFRLRGVSPGAQAVTIDYRRPGEPALKTVRFEIVVR